MSSKVFDYRFDEEELWIVYNSIRHMESILTGEDTVTFRKLKRRYHGLLKEMKSDLDFKVWSEDEQKYIDDRRKN